MGSVRRTLFLHLVHGVFEAFLLQVVKQDLAHQFTVEFVRRALAFVLVLFLFGGVEGLLQVRALNMYSLLDGLAEGRDALEILLVTVDHVFESLFCLLQVFCETDVGLLLRQLFLLLGVLVVVLKIVKLLRLLCYFLLLIDHIFLELVKEA